MCGSDGDAPETPYKTPANLKPTPLASARDGDLVVEEFPVTHGGHTYPHSRIAYVKGRPPLPVVLVHHNYAGLKQFDIDQACFLARVGYVGLAVDLYQETANYTYANRNPTKDDGAEKLQAHFHGAFDLMIGLLRSPGPWRSLMRAYLDAAFEHLAVARGRAGAIGYCLGGQSCFEQVRAGHPLQVVVSLHGLLHSRPTYRDDPYNSLRRITREEFAEEVGLEPNSYTPGCRVVVENGAWDAEVPPESIGEFFQEMDANAVDFRFNVHSQTPHGWALGPGVTGGADNYREAADRRSTLSMLAAFAEAWPDVPQRPVPSNACGTALPRPVTEAAQYSTVLTLVVAMAGMAALSRWLSRRA
mmetsp:Transcript_25007/g.70451  ORF Transcript_25007/g.70451 Transcript_25007/m.70451 type:complete len:359 (+) Transcript_25007:57-1133(+)